MPIAVINPFILIPPTVSPTLYGNLAAWWKADSLSLADTTPVGDGGASDWLDSSGNNKRLSQTTSGSRPVFRTNQFGALPAISFSGSTFLNVSSALTLSGDFTAIVVCKQAAGNDGELLGNSTTNIQARKNRSLTNNISMYAGNQELVSALFSSSQSALVACIWRRSGTAGSLREDITDRTSGSPTYSGSWNLDQVAKSTGAAGTNPFIGLIAEILVYSAFRSDSECDNLYNNYLKSRWGLP
jgi:hypothetical protein